MNCGGTSNAVDAFDDLLNSSSNKVIKTKVDVRSENAAKFRDMFDKGEVPEGKEPEKEKSEKDAELEQMRKNKREQREYFKMMEAGKLDEQKTKEPKMLVGKFKDVRYFSFFFKFMYVLCYCILKRYLLFFHLCYIPDILQATDQKERKHVRL